MDMLAGQSSTDEASLIAKSAEMVDMRNSISMRSQAYASMAVVAALIAGISVTFLVEVDYTFAENDSTTYVLLQAAVAGCLVVCFLSLYGTTVLSMQYYLVTRALGHVPSTDVVEQQQVLDEVMAFMANTRWVRHTAVKCVIVRYQLDGAQNRQRAQCLSEAVKGLSLKSLVSLSSVNKWVRDST